MQSHAQEVFRQRNDRVRIAVLHEIDSLTLTAGGVYQVVSSEGEPLAFLGAHRPHHVQITRGLPGGRAYRLVLRELESHQVDSAIAIAKAARDAHGLPVKVLRIPGQGDEASRIIVTVGEFPSAEEARDYLKKHNLGSVEYIYEERARAREGQVRLLDKEGKLVASDGRSIRLVPLDVGKDALTLQETRPKGDTRNQVDKPRSYRGEFELAINEEGTLTAVNDLWVEYYLYSVVSGEIGSDAPLEALKAQAVAARSEAVAKIQRGIVSSSFFDFYDTALAQIYRGVGDESERVRRAVDATRGEILVWKGHAADAVYSHSCGGMIASSRDMWDGHNEGYAVRKRDSLPPGKAADLSDWERAHNFILNHRSSLCRPDQAGFPKYARKYYRWERKFTGEKFSRLANERYGTGTVKDIEVLQRNASGRVRKMKIVGEKKTAVIDRELEIRRALGGIYSTFFTWAKTYDKDRSVLRSLTIFGAGYGHGVGMCQMGAFMMAKRGYNYRQILGHYYQNVKMRRLYR